MCFTTSTTASTDRRVTVELTINEVKQFIADIDGLRDLRIRLKRLLVQMETKQDAQYQLQSGFVTAIGQERQTKDPPTKPPAAD
jgi:hypothetical protein